MRKVYKNPKELATCLKDLVDLYFEDLMTYEKLEERVSKIVEANKDSIYKNGVINTKLANVLGDLRIDVINKIVKEKIKKIDLILI
ncbi:TIGR04540 family protein [Clostridium botulinum]|nr:TIGR04540 family protein [Clostridium botulinum]NFC11809.1 TIGR04540 family protein [Clostridium botulinum]NFC15597.1 TIGR04540 family protein [Clostridium botulinum]NFC19386.1 TIGR04540 family protein [Clostridium botulinum]NFC25947.1 TIGR04540 family protein [Clostridium botulinum]